MLREKGFASFSVIPEGSTALHIAVLAGNMRLFVRLSQCVSQQVLLIKNKSGITAVDQICELTRSYKLKDKTALNWSYYGYLFANGAHLVQGCVDYGNVSVLIVVLSFLTAEEIYRVLEALKIKSNAR